MQIEKSVFFDQISSFTSKNLIEKYHKKISGKHFP